MNLSTKTPHATDCSSCYGTGIIVPPVAGVYPDYLHLAVAHPYSIACTCTSTPGKILLGNYHKLGLAQAAGLVVWVDEEMIIDIERLWRAGVPTVGSCKGSTVTPNPRYVIVAPGFEEQAREILPWTTSIQHVRTGIALCGPAAQIL